MSWRTHGFYKGLSRAQRTWLRAFDRKWDTKAEGRRREDAFDHLGDASDSSALIRPKSDRRKIKIAEIPVQDSSPLPDDSELALLVHEIARFTVPHPPRGKRGKWTIHLVLTTGEKVSLHFKEQESALQAYEILRKAFSILPGL